MWYSFFADESSRADAHAAPARGQAGGDPDGEFDEEDEELVGSSDMNQALENVVPWMISILFHLGLVVLALFLVWSLIPADDDADKNIIPVARMSENPGGSLASTEKVNMQKTQNVRKVESKDVSETDSIDNLNNTEADLTSLLGAAGGGGGKLAPFGTTSGGNSGMGVGLYGAGGNASKIIYIVDASGSLIDSLPFVIKELKRSVNELSSGQKFTVIFFQKEEAIEAPPRGLKPATPENKKKVADWITLDGGNIIPQGSSSPINAIQLAMRYKPELVFILSDNITGSGKYEVDRRQLMGILDKSNKDRKMKINTIQFLYPDELNTLKEIAAEHGGIYKFIKESDLGLE